MREIDEILKDDLPSALEGIKFERKAEVRRAAGRYRVLYGAARTILASAAALAVITTVSLGSLVWVPEVRDGTGQQPLIVAGERPFAAELHMKNIQTASLEE